MFDLACRAGAAAVAACASFFGASARAEGSLATLAPSERLDFLLPTEGLNADVGAGLVVRPKALGSRVNVVDVVPVLEVQWGRDLHLSLDDGLTYAPLRLGPLAIGAVVEWRQSYESPRLVRGLRTADNSEAGGLARLSTPYGDIEARVRRSLDGDQTDSADLSFDTAIQSTPRLAFALEARGSWANEAFQIPGRKTRANPRPLPKSKMADYYAAGVQIAAVYRVTDAWRLTGLASLDEIIGADAKALRLTTRNVPNVSLVLTRRFKVF